METTTTTTSEESAELYASFEAFRYEDGEEMQQQWNPAFVIFAYVLSCVSSYAAVHLLDHGLWRSDDSKKVAVSIRYPDIYAACLLAFGSVWSMHFVGMGAVTLRGAPICYDWPKTFISLAAVLVMMVAGIKIAGHDVFATSKRGKILQEILGNKYMSDREAMWAITKIVCTHKLQHLIVGSFLAASGAIVMHYTGMIAQRGPFRKEWNYGFVAVSVVSGVMICFVGFWIIFRLRWKIKQFWLRYVSAMVISGAVCFLHFFGMLGATYIADHSKTDSCLSTWEMSSESPGAWTSHQMLVVALGIIVPSIALYFENLISQELIMTYDFTTTNQVSSRFADDKSKMKSFLTNNSQNYDDAFDEEESGDDPFGAEANKPIADLFTDTTILAANITGFTAWSSMREPSQVFMLLETVYQTFDKIAKSHRVLRIETVGDSYVAVAGLPDPRKDHAVVMCRLARDFVSKMSILTQKLEVVLGPDTGDLNIRVGIHSGPVTAGILRAGDKAMFQLYGETMNLTSRLETSGSVGRVQVSSDTAELLKAAGKGKWVTPRKEEIFIKGKGSVQCYWLKAKGTHGMSRNSESEEGTNRSFASSMLDSSTQAAGEEFYRLTSDKTERLIEWNVENLVRLLREIVARRNAMTARDSRAARGRRESTVSNGSISCPKGEGETVLDEVCEVIDLPEFDLDAAKHQKHPDSIEIPEVVINQLKDYVKCLANLYHSNPFHNFEHASHVAMSVTKLLSRIVAYSSNENTNDANKSVAQTLSENTFGITSDPLTQFACVLSALMHDADHQGVPNSQLIAEGVDIASYYKNKSVAEQNSVDLAWHHLMDDNFKDLRATIYANEDEMQRFRQLVVNSVMATDIMDKDLKDLRNNRWEKAFSEQDKNEDPSITKNRKATIVIEHLIQASDVAHTMQHWHIYRKWNQCLFEEMYKAFKEGRMEKDPSEFWYKGEIGFFDFYIIPLAKKLKNCGVFGVSSDEYLNYAQQNRREWEACGEQAVAEMIEKVKTVWAEIEANADDGDTSETSEDQMEFQNNLDLNNSGLSK